MTKDDKVWYILGFIMLPVLVAVVVMVLCRYW